MTDRIENISPSATLAVDNKAKELSQQGVDIISFAAGEPDFDTPRHIVEKAAETCRDSLSHKYTSAAGLAQLRDAVAIDSNRTAGSSNVSRENVCITNGAKQAVFSALAAIVNPGDEVILPVPYWTTYPEVIEFFGGLVKFVAPADPASPFPSVNELVSASTEKTKALIWCSPSNPTGAIASTELNKAVLKWCRENGIWIISDEIYRKLYYGDDLPFCPTLRSISDEPYDRLVVVDGVSKSYSMTGWRVGWIIASARFISGVSRLQSHMASNVNNIAQFAAAEAITGEQDSARAMVERFRERRDRIFARISSIPGFSVSLPDGAFYVFPEVRDACTKMGISTTEEFAVRLLEEVGVAVVPGEAFGRPGFIRLSYALADDRLEEGMNRIEQFVSGYST